MHTTGGRVSRGDTHAVDEVVDVESRIATLHGLGYTRVSLLVVDIVLPGREGD